MGVRDISPQQFNGAKGTARVTIGAVLSSLGYDPQDIPILISNFSPTSVQNYTLTATHNHLAVPDTTNQRGVILVAPYQNGVGWTVKGADGDTGLLQNNLGIFVSTFNAAGVPAYVVVDVGSTMAGFTAIWF